MESDRLPFTILNPIIVHLHYSVKYTLTVSRRGFSEKILLTKFTLNLVTELRRVFQPFPGCLKFLSFINGSAISN